MLTRRAGTEAALAYAAARKDFAAAVAYNRSVRAFVVLGAAESRSMGMFCEVYRVPAATVERLADEPAGLIEIMSDLEGPDDAVSLEKSWHGLHFVLTGSADAGSSPLDFLIAGGARLDGEGAERLIAPTDVRQIAAALANITEPEFAARFDRGAMDEAGVYPRIWDEPLDELLEEYFEYFEELKSLVARAAESNSGLLVTMG